MAPVKPMGVDRTGKVPTKTERTVTGFEQEYNQTPSQPEDSAELDPAHVVDLVTPANEARERSAEASNAAAAKVKPEAPIKAPRARKTAKK